MPFWFGGGRLLDRSRARMAGISELSVETSPPVAAASSEPLHRGLAKRFLYQRIVSREGRRSLNSRKITTITAPRNGNSEKPDSRSQRRPSDLIAARNQRSVVGRKDRKDRAVAA